MEEKIRIIDVSEGNVSETGFFCFQNRRNEEGFKKKLGWLRERFREGLKIKLIREGGRGVIEYIPGEHAWRPVNAKGYMFIHCLWITGRRRNVGCATSLLNECIKDAKAAKMKGVAMVTSEGHFLVGKRFLAKHGFESVAQAPPSFELMVKKFGKADSPSFRGDWDAKLKRFGKGLTIVTSNQCPYFHDGAKTLVDAAKELGIKSKVIEMVDCHGVQDSSPSPYGTFSVILDGELLSYYPLGKKPFLKSLEKLGK